ncbi:MAG TPA: dihydroorotate dehydrogenase [Nitrospirae bacterium]|nr:dihydroorotate dehydrogenase [Nitrospirota bacterium]
MNLEVSIGHMRMKNPVTTASGTFGYGGEYAGFVDLNMLGAVTVKGISLEPHRGNPPPRLYETACGMLNSIGLQNVGLERFLKEKLPYLRRFDTKVIVNILGGSIDEYCRLASGLDGKVDAIELNVSCPNVKRGGIIFSSNTHMLRSLIREVRAVVKRSVLIVKLSPNSSDIVQHARISEAEGADAVSMINTIAAMAIDIHTRKPRLSNIIGGLSGPAIKPIGVRMVWEAHRSIGIPIVGMGGIMTAEDAIEYMLAGARAVSVGTANFVNPRATMEILEGIKSYMQTHGIDDINKIIGGLIC